MTHEENFRRFAESNLLYHLDPTFRYMCAEVEERMRRQDEHENAVRQQEFLELLLNLSPRP